MISSSDKYDKSGTADIIALKENVENSSQLELLNEMQNE